MLPYGDTDALEALFAVRGNEIAAVITEAIPANMGVGPPLPGFNQRIRELTKANNAVFILDEVMTGFRVRVDGWWGIEVRIEAWQSDLFTYGKVIGGGMPLAAVAGITNIVSEAFTRNGVVHQAQSAGNLFSFFITDHPVRTYGDAKAQNANVFATFFHAMLDNGVWLPPSAYEAGFVSAAHTDDDLATIERAAEIAAGEAARQQ